MSSDYEQKREKWFLQGLRVAEGGLQRDTCPYDLKPDGSARLTWLDGWKFGRYIATQKMRKEMHEQVKYAIQSIFSHQESYTEFWRIRNQGLLKAGFKYFYAKNKASEIAQQILDSKEHRLLKELYIEVYLPCRPSEDPYSIAIYDQQLTIFGDYTEQPFRKLVDTYGDRHGVRQAWHDYVYTEEINLLVEQMRGKHS